MAYGTEDTTLANFDQIVPDEVFQEVTSITLEQFRFLRDGGDYKDTATGETKHFDGKLFDEVVFDDSIKEFLRLKRELANYFDPANEKDIFDYIPPQRTNQILPRKQPWQRWYRFWKKKIPDALMTRTRPLLTCT